MPDRPGSMRCRGPGAGSSVALGKLLLPRERQCQYITLLACERRRIVGAHRDVQDMAIAKIDQRLADQCVPIRDNRASVPLHTLIL